MTARDDIFVQRAIRLAMAGRGYVEPNPMVGCVLARDGVIIGEGIHARVGGPHAEPTALADCRSRGQDPAGATAYVTLEPCCHVNKRTPPCAPRLIEAKVARVVIGCVDPNPQVDGKGVAMLRVAGIVVDFASAEVQAEAKQLLAPFILATRGVGPYVTLKWAETADGFVAKPGGGRTSISNTRSNRAVHELRSRCDAIVVGVGTAIADDPDTSRRADDSVAAARGVGSTTSIAVDESAGYHRARTSHPHPDRALGALPPPVPWGRAGERAERRALRWRFCRAIYVQRPSPQPSPRVPGEGVHRGWRGS